MVTNPPEPTAIPGGAPTPPVGLPIPAATGRHEPVRRPMIRTFHHEDFAAADLAALKARHGHRVSVCLPARDEAATVGVIVERLRKSLVEDVDLVDEVLVVDDHSTDRTAEVRSEEHTSELQSLMRNSYAVFCLTKKNSTNKES